MPLDKNKPNKAFLYSKILNSDQDLYAADPLI